MLMIDFDTPESPCPNCGHVHNGALTADVEKNVAPKPDDITICIKCQAVSVFDDDMRLREPTEEEVLEIPLLELSRAQRALKEMLEA